MRRIHGFKRSSILTSGLMFLLVLGLCGPAAAQDKKDTKDTKEKKEKSFTVNKWAYKRLNEAHELLSKNKFKEALSVVETMRGRRKLNDHERSLMWQTFGYIYSSQERFDKAIHSFENCLLLGEMPQGSLLDIQFNLGQLYMANKQYDKAIRTLTSWLAKAENPAPRSKYLLAGALIQAKRYKKALYYSKQAIASVKRPQEAWLQQLLAIQFQLKNFKEVAKVLSRLVTMYPRRAYWLQLSAVYSELKQSAKALAVLELAYIQKFLTSAGELLNYASMLMYHGIPYRAAKVIEKGMKDGIIKRNLNTLRQLGDAYLRSRELGKALKPLMQAADMDDKGDIWIRVAQIHLEKEEWGKASKALDSAIKKGKLTDTGNAHLLLGIAYFRTNKSKLAKKAFEAAAQFKSTKNSAKQWLKVLAQKSKV